MSKIADPRLRTYAVWVPKRGGEEQDVRGATKYLSDRRVRHFWDGDGLLMKSYDRALSLGEDAWDIYFLYGPDARWDGELPPVPSFWMHQLRNQPEDKLLDASELAKQANQLLAHGAPPAR